MQIDPRTAPRRRTLPLLKRISVFLLAWLFWGSGGAAAQLIPIRTAPVATGSQFQLFPAERYGMGDVSIAVDDPLGDAFVNPAKAGRLSDTWTFASPSHYTVSGRDEAASTAAVGAITRWGRWFGGGGFAVQRLGLVDPEPTVWTWDFAANTIIAPPTPPPIPDRLRESSARNVYGTALAGMTLSSGWALAGSVFWAGLDAMDGVDLLYPQREALRQDGHRLNLRVGLLGTWDEASVSAVLLHDRVDMTHDVTNARFEWNEDTEQRTAELQTTRNLDRTNTWGLHLEYVQPIRPDGWRLGTILTGNRKSHPKIPNYELMNIPRDPGTSWAYNFGVGIAHSTQHATVGADVVFEPIFSDTWAEAQSSIPVPGGDVIQAGAKTVENDFEFANSTFRLGGRFEDDWLSLRVGAELHTVRYWLTQQDHVEQTKRDQYESWSEWTLTWGTGFKWLGTHLRYTARWTLGTGRPGVQPRITSDFAALASGIVVAPRGDLTVNETDVFTHQLSLVVPISTSE